MRRTVPNNQIKPKTDGRWGCSMSQSIHARRSALCASGVHRAAALICFAGVFALSLFAPGIAAQPALAAVPQLKELVDLDLEQLSRITVTSVTLREQRLS